MNGQTVRVHIEQRPGGNEIGVRFVRYNADSESDALAELFEAAATWVREHPHHLVTLAGFHRGWQWHAHALRLTARLPVPGATA